ncbi:hypothetical protein [uncultured Methanoregula sp.]|uniref:hypothetical protein n=1 Tax=uncultured Methanoregula sp. TaxID=1005933 RepID=UPI002AAA96A1|nr:hypothetical protein [uncultured Methanoregula sp.]
MNYNPIFILCIIVLLLTMFEMPVTGVSGTTSPSNTENSIPGLFVPEPRMGTPFMNMTVFDKKTHIKNPIPLRQSRGPETQVYETEKNQTSCNSARFLPDAEKSATCVSPQSPTPLQKTSASSALNYFVSKNGLIYRSKNGIRDVFDIKGKKLFSAEDVHNRSSSIEAIPFTPVKNEKQYGYCLTERAVNGQFDQVTETHEQEIQNEEHEIWTPPTPDRWSFPEINGPEMFWEPDDWEAERPDFHASGIISHTGDRGAIRTVLDATGGQYIRVTMGHCYSDSESMEVYLDDILLGNITTRSSPVQFDISGRSWTTTSTLKLVAGGHQRTNTIVRSVSLMANDTIEPPLLGFNVTLRSKETPLEIVPTNKSTDSSVPWFWSFGNGDPALPQYDPDMRNR